METSIDKMRKKGLIRYAPQKMEKRPGFIYVQICSLPGFLAGQRLRRLRWFRDSRWRPLNQLQLRDNAGPVDLRADGLRQGRPGHGRAKEGPEEEPGGVDLEHPQRPEE